MTFKWEGDKLAQVVKQTVAKVIVRRTERVREIAVKSILAGGKTGAIYTRRGSTHQASAPGQPPASDTGRLAQSGITSYENSSLTGRVTFSTEYALPLELGTERMDPRPFLRPALQQGTEGMQEELDAELQGVLS